MKLRIVAVGTRPPAWVRDGFAEYARRMPRQTSLELIELATRQQGPPAQFKQAEGKAILQRVASDDHVVVLDECGHSRDSDALAGRLEVWRGLGRDVVFVVGGAAGLDDAVRERAQETLRLSDLTLPHYLVRVMLAEALYRAWSINAGHPYHRE
ncbi:MAG: 23S rRNA (pseudouridine(1915)-N(3))-methyltransferase RlmH [Pseudomonadota bacterium]